MRSQDIQAYSLKHNTTSHRVIFHVMSFKTIIITVLAAMAVHAAPSSRAADISGDGKLLWGITMGQYIHEVNSYLLLARWWHRCLWSSHSEQRSSCCSQFKPVFWGIQLRTPHQCAL